MTFFLHRHTGFSPVSQEDMARILCHYCHETLKQVQGDGRNRKGSRAAFSLYRPTGFSPVSQEDMARILCHCYHTTLKQVQGDGRNRKGPE